uniref:Protein roadkill n=1 Tax=Macrostomum lignano TaxID=282301 RepID=A0A1I8GDN1_9PLAT
MYLNSYQMKTVETSKSSRIVNANGPSSHEDRNRAQNQSANRLIAPLRGYKTQRHPIQLHHHHHHHQKQRQKQSQKTDRSAQCGGDSNRGNSNGTLGHEDRQHSQQQRRQPDSSKQQRGDAEQADESAGEKPPKAQTAAAGDSVAAVPQYQQQQFASNSKPVKSIIYLALSNDFASSSSSVVVEQQQQQSQQAQAFNQSDVNNAESPSTMTIESPDDGTAIEKPDAVLRTRKAPGNHYCISSQTTIAIRLAAAPSSQSNDDSDAELSKPSASKVKKASVAMVPRMVLSRSTYVAPTGALPPMTRPAATTMSKSTAATPTTAPANRCIRFNLASGTWAPVCQQQQPLTGTEECSTTQSKDRTGTILTGKQPGKCVYHQPQPQPQQVCPSVFHHGKPPHRTVTSRPAMLTRRVRPASTIRQQAKHHRNQSQADGDSPAVATTATGFLPRYSFAEQCRPPSVSCRMTSSIARRCVEFSPRCWHTVGALAVASITLQQAFLGNLLPPKMPAVVATAAHCFYLENYALNRVARSFPDIFCACIRIELGELVDNFNSFTGNWLHQNSSLLQRNSNLEWQQLQTRANLMIHRPLSLTEESNDGLHSLLLQHRSDCCLFERLSLTARLFPDVGGYFGEENSSASSTALLTYIDYPVELHLLASALQNCSNTEQFYHKKHRLLKQAVLSNVSNDETIQPAGSVQVTSSKRLCRSHIIFQPTTSSSTESADCSTTCTSSSEYTSSSDDSDCDCESEICSLYSWSCSSSEF